MLELSLLMCNYCNNYLKMNLLPHLLMYLNNKIVPLYSILKNVYISNVSISIHKYLHEIHLLSTGKLSQNMPILSQFLLSNVSSRANRHNRLLKGQELVNKCACLTVNFHHRSILTQLLNFFALLCLCSLRIHRLKLNFSKEISLDIFTSWQCMS